MRHRHCWKPCNQTRDLMGGVSHVSIWDNVIDQAKALGIGSLDDLPQEKYLVCFDTSNTRRQEPARTDFRNEPQLGEWRRKFDRVVGEDDIAVEQHRKANANGVTLDGSHDRLSEKPEATRQSGATANPDRGCNCPQ